MSDLAVIEDRLEEIASSVEAIKGGLEHAFDQLEKRGLIESELYGDWRRGKGILKYHITARLKPERDLRASWVAPLEFVILAPFLLAALFALVKFVKFAWEF